MKIAEVSVHRPVFAVMMSLALVSRFQDGDERYTVRMRLDEQFRRDPSTMGDLFVPASGGRMVRVSDVAALTMERAPTSIERYNRMRQYSVNA
ncbi:MAG TPA: efflux RND transporter permease subunit, partial [Vicinamibacterales bacterium]|nr:efflux RND transporter permease subunit [Vicinamibacterales bacterium]